MRIAVWKTGHEIADTVGRAVSNDLETQIFHTAPYTQEYLQYLQNYVWPEYDAHIAYGILRGTADVFRECDRQGLPWFNIDRGYFKPGHYDGYYRVSLKGTQQTIGLDNLEPDMDRWKALGVDLKPWRGFDPSKPVLVCPPTEAVQQFFNINPGYPDLWRQNAVAGMWLRDDTYVHFRGKVRVREKGDPTPINYDDYNYVRTFNSSVGWQALQHGIPCISDPTHSIVGAYFNSLSERLPQDQSELAELQYIHRERLFGIMSGLQMTLDEMRAGKLWELLSHLLSTSATTPASPSAPTSALTPSRKEHSFLPTSAA